jgi:hypothetical protein
MIIWMFIIANFTRTQKGAGLYLQIRRRFYTKSTLCFREGTSL